MAENHQSSRHLPRPHPSGSSKCTDGAGSAGAGRSLALRLSREWLGVSNNLELDVSSCDRTAATPSTRVVPTQDAHGAEYGVVAMPGSDLICGALDPVAIVASSGSLGLMIDEKECLVIIDRGEVDFSDRSFFCYADANGNCSIRRMDDAYEGWTILGKVACVTLPWDADSMAKKGTWMEEDD